MKKIQNRQLELKFVSWGKIKTYEFNSLKEASGRDVSKLKNAIVNNNFSFPLYIWGKYILDGAGRKKALEELEAEGYQIPDLPVIEIAAKDMREAKKLVLQASSEHGETTQESFSLFIADLDLEPFEFGEFNFDFADSMNNYNNLDTDDQDLLDPESEKKPLNDYVVILQLTPELKQALESVKDKPSFILEILEKELL